jgi:hypothetical protein
MQRTFFPGFPSTSPTTFSPLPTIVSTTFSVFVRGFFALTTPAPVAALGLVAVVRGLEVLALGVLVLGVMASAMDCTNLGLEFPMQR